MGKLVRRGGRERDALASLSLDSRSPLHAAKAQTTSVLERKQMGARELCNAAHGLASCKLGPEAPAWAAVWSALEVAYLARLAEFTPQGLVISAWAFATVGYESEALYATVRRRAISELPTFSPQGVSNTAWTFATAGHLSAPLGCALAGEMAVRSPADFKPMELANVVWSFAKSGEYCL